LNKRPGQLHLDGFLAAHPASYFIHGDGHPVETCLCCVRTGSFRRRGFLLLDRAISGGILACIKILGHLLVVVMPPAGYPCEGDLVDDFEGEVRVMLEFISSCPGMMRAIAYFLTNDRFVARPVQSGATADRQHEVDL